MRILLLLLIWTMASSALAETVDRVILVSVDGLRADLLNDLLANDPGGNYPAFRRLVDEGASTFNARTDYTHTVTLPNHTSMVTGRPVLQPAYQSVAVPHGYVSNVLPGPDDTLHNQGNPALPYVASAFDVAHDHGLSTGMYASKDKFIIFDQSYDATRGAPDMTGPDFGRDKIDVYRFAASGSPSNAADLHAMLMADLPTGPLDFTFVHYRDLDTAGHELGWGSAAWTEVVQDVDGYRGDILDFVTDNPVLMGRTIVVVTADHGGTGRDHSYGPDWRNFPIPFFAWGHGVPAGQDLYEMNQVSRLDAGGGRPDYDAPMAPIRNGDSGNLALGLLGLPAIPGSTINDEQDLEVMRSVTGVPLAAGLVAASVEAWPNPFNPRTEIRFELARTAEVDLAVYDLSGKLVRTLARGISFGPGTHGLTWTGLDDGGRSLSSGVYLYRLDSGNDSVTNKIVLMK
jgi:hypothetical protein